MRHLTFLLLLIIAVLTSCSEKQEQTNLQSFNIADVKITGGDFYKAQQAGLKYMLELDMDRLLAPFIQEAGIEPLKESYGNWENSGLDGHIGGHYLSALSFMYAATGKKELLDRINYMVEWLDTCQQKNGNGYVGGIPGGKAMWEEISKGEIDAGSFSLNKKWVPLYNIHKIYAGLRDVYLNTNNKKALDILVKLTDWCIETTKNLSDEQLQEILRSEHGGLNETFVDVADITGDKKYMELAKRFSHNAILEPLLHHKNELTGLHANTQIPKIIGYKRYAEAASDTAWSNASSYFWDLVIDNWTVAIGGNSVREHFHPANDFSSMVESNQGPETCNTYNMLRLSKMLFLTNPEAKYLDYYERALYNHILSSIHPEKSGYVYFTPMRPRHYRVYSQSQECFWCCVGSGLENPGKYNEMIYLHDDNNLYVNLFIPSVLNWKEKGVELIQETSFPNSEKSTLVVKLDVPKEFEINIRKPSWVKDNTFGIKVNGKTQDTERNNNAYFVLKREWQNNDTISIEMPMKTQVEYLPDSSNWVAFLHGPIVMAAAIDTSNLDGLWADDSRMGHVANGKMLPIDDAPMLVSDDKDILSKVSKAESVQLALTIDGLINQEKYKGLKLVPFYQIHEARYMIYWPFFTKEEFKERLAQIKKDEEALLALEAITVDQVATGEQQPESDHNFKGENTESGINKDRYWRHAAGWFSYDLKNKKKEGKILRITYCGLDKDREFYISLNNQVLDTVKMVDKGNVFYDIDYKIPQKIIDKSTGIMQIKFEAAKGSIAGGVYHVRLLKEE